MQQQLRNIGRSNEEDPNYRYKMPALQVRNEGRGNGVHTRLLNLTDVGRALRLEPKHLAKFLSFELSVRSSGPAADGTFRIAGTHSAAQVNRAVDRLCALFVVCPACRDPELRWEGGAHVVGDCAACGFRDRLPGQHHRFHAYFAAAMPRRKQRPHAAAIIDTKGLAAGATEEAEEVEEAEEEGGEGGAGEWSLDTSAEARRARRAAELGSRAYAGVDAVESDADDDPGTRTAVTRLRDFMGARPTPKAVAVAGELRRLQLVRALSDAEMTRVLLEATLPSSSGTGGGGGTLSLRPVVLPILIELRTTQRQRGVPLSAPAILDALTGTLLASSARPLMREVPRFLYELYSVEPEVLSEDDFLVWWVTAEGRLPAPLRARVALFARWLETAEEEEEVEEEEKVKVKEERSVVVQIQLAAPWNK